MSKTNNTHLERIKDAVHKSDGMSEAEKSSSVKIIEEWAIEDKAMGLLSEELQKISAGIKPILSELGWN
ncbi:MAG: hypothetical protein DRG24_03565 [Epsilonproteobacteria bacterium]|nr:MAG: hypothetical protein DRG24_03565 [Campylobacterota bacterium]